MARTNEEARLDVSGRAKRGDRLEAEIDPLPSGSKARKKIFDLKFEMLEHCFELCPSAKSDDWSVSPISKSHRLAGEHVWNKSGNNYLIGFHIGAVLRSAEDDGILDGNVP